MWIALSVPVCNINPNHYNLFTTCLHFFPINFLCNRFICDWGKIFAAFLMRCWECHGKFFFSLFAAGKNPDCCILNELHWRRVTSNRGGDTSGDAAMRCTQKQESSYLNLLRIKNIKEQKERMRWKKNGAGGGTGEKPLRFTQTVKRH